MGCAMFKRDLVLLIYRGLPWIYNVSYTMDATSRDGNKSKSRLQNNISLNNTVKLVNAETTI